MESSRTHFEVLGLGLDLEASSPQKLACPRLEDSTIFEPLKFCWKTLETLRKICKDLFFVSSSRNRPKKIFEDLYRLKKIFENHFFFEIAWKKILKTFFLESTCVCVLGPWFWPREGLSLALASKFFCVLDLGLEPCVLDSTSEF